MLPAPDARTRLNAIDADIAEVVRLIAEKNLSIKLGDHEASGAENRAHEMRAVLEQLWRQRRRAWQELQESQTTSPTAPPNLFERPCTPHFENASGR
jgi:hypothetical protein